MNTLRVNRNIFEYGKKKLRFKDIWIHVNGPKNYYQPSMDDIIVCPSQNVYTCFLLGRKQ